MDTSLLSFQCFFCDIIISSEGSHSQAHTFSFRSHQPLKFGLTEKCERNIHLPSEVAFPGAGDLGEEGRWQTHSPRKT